VNSLPSLATKPPRSSVGQDTAGGGARQLGGAGEIAQRHRTAGGAKHLKQPQAAIEAFDEVGGALLAALELWHWLAPPAAPIKDWTCRRPNPCHNSPISSIGEQIFATAKGPPP
jgi:hypothetical protein